MALAPIAIFAYRRPNHLRMTLESLLRTPEFRLSPVVIYCDGPKDPVDAELVEQTRNVARQLAPVGTRFVFREKNQGLRRSIVEGVTALCAQYGRVIVVEDDLVVNEQFLSYLNAGLDQYASDEQVMQVSAHIFPVMGGAITTPIFMPFTTTWGWATWQRAWQHYDDVGTGYEKLLKNKEMRHRFDLDGSYPYFKMLVDQRKGRVDSWGILWYLSVFFCDGIVIYPNKSLVINKGFDGSGTNCATASLDETKIDSCRSELVIPDSFADFPPDKKVDVAAFVLVKKYLKVRGSLLSKIKGKIIGIIERYDY